MVLIVCIFLFVLVVLIINYREVQKCTENTWDSLKFILWSPLLVILSLVIAATMPLGKLIQLLVSGAIKIKFGNDYNGILKGTDMAMACNIWQYSFIKIFLVIEYNKAIATKPIFEYVKDIMEKNRSQNKMNKKFFSTLDQSLGYLFFKAIQIEISDFIRKIPLSEIDLDETETISVLRKCMSEPLPFEGTALWDMHVGTQPLKWKSNSDPNIEYYPLLVRVHHGIADGTTLVKHLKLIFNDGAVSVKPEVFPTSQHKQTSHLLMVFKKVWDVSNGVFLFISAMYVVLFLRGHDKNGLTGKPFRNDELFHFGNDEGGTYFKKVKRIKKLHGCISFSEIILAAYSASLNQYYLKHCSHCPKSITLGLPVVINRNQFNGIASGNINVKNVDVSNNFVFLQMPLPVQISTNTDFDPKTPSISRLNAIRKVSKNLRSVSQQQFGYVLIHQFLGCLPTCVAQTFLRNINSTTAGSFLPGPPKFSFCDGALAISDCLFWLPHIIQIGISITTLTFDDRLQMGLSCNGQIDNQSHIDEILKNVYKQIDIIEEELESYFKIN
ncbi:hypothetical protein FQR65_LT00822 [Abscondita terminalis]|nr:hypothetical protein FQR65_LT00822 [Abscondita terminalis]